MATKKISKKLSAKVSKAMRSNSGRSDTRVTSRTQAIAIGSQPRRSVGKMPKLRKAR
jgi:hypothetical protein